MSKEHTPVKLPSDILYNQSSTTQCKAICVLIPVSRLVTCNEIIHLKVSNYLKLYLFLEYVHDMAYQTYRSIVTRIILAILSLIYRGNLR